MQEQVIDSDGFRLYARSLEVKFELQRVFFNENSARVKLKCVSLVREMSSAIKESVVTIYVPSMDQLSNQKLINWRSDGKHKTLLTLSVWRFLYLHIVICFLLFSLLNVFVRNQKCIVVDFVKGCFG